MLNRHFRRVLLFPKVLTMSLLGITATVVVLEAWPRNRPDPDSPPPMKAVQLLATVPPPKVKAVESAPAEPPRNAAPTFDSKRHDALTQSQNAPNVFGPGGLGTGINNALGGLAGGAGIGGAHGVGGLGARGAGPGSGGLGLGIGAAMGGRVAGMGAPTRYEPPVPTGRDRFNDHGVNGFVEPSKDPLSTFAIDVDTASYTIVRRMLNEGLRPPPEAVRAEEIINYFDYGYASPTEGPFAVHLEAAPSPFSTDTHLLRVGVQARRLAPDQRKPTHLTFLVDVSCSMSSEDRLPLAQQALHVLVDNLRPNDTVALVTYAGSVRRVLGQTGMQHRALIHQAIDDLQAAGSTAMGSGLQLAYEEARKVLRPGHVSRVIVLSDGDANVGATTFPELLSTIEAEVKRGVTLTTVGFGMGNYRDDLMEQLADKGNGNSYYVDTLAEARRIFEDRVAGTLEVIAKDVKLQVVFDPQQVRRYRLVGYENRDVADRDFRNDAVDGGEIGAGHSVTALYELELLPNAGAGFARVHVRAKPPEGDVAEESVFALGESMIKSRFEDASQGFRFATAVMGFAERMRGSPWAAGWSLERAYLIARAAVPSHGAEAKERTEFTQIVRRFDEFERGRPMDR